MASGFIEIDFEECKACELCIAFCPKNNITKATELNKRGYFPAKFVSGIGKHACNGCALCAVVCPDIAIVVKRNDDEK